MMSEEVLEQELESQVVEDEPSPAPEDVIDETIVDADAGTVDTEPVVDDSPPDEGGEEEVVEFDDGLLDRAEQYGLTDDQIEAFGTPEALEASLSAFDRRFAAVGRQVASQQAQAQEQPVAQNQAPVVPVAPVQEQPPVAKTNGQIVDLSKYKDSMDDDAFAAVESVYNASRASDEKINVLEQQLQQLVGNITQQQQSQANATIAREIDAIVASFGEDWKETFGTKATESLNVNVSQGPDGKMIVTGPDAEHWQAKNKLAIEINALYMGYQNTGVTIPEQNEIGKRALRIAFGQDQTKRDRAKLKKRLTKKSQQSTRRPTHREVGEEKTPEEKDNALIAMLDARKAQHDRAEAAAEAEKSRPRSRKKK